MAIGKHVLCDMSEVPAGSCKSFTIEGTRIALYNVSGTFHATQNHCTHKGAQLVNGTLEGAVIECSQHGWKFDVGTGACLSPGHGRKLRTYEVYLEQSSVIIELQDAARPGAAAVSNEAGNQPVREIEYHAVASCDDLEDEEVIAVSVGTQEIALYRIDGEFYATHGLCTHENVKLCDGFVEGDFIECPKHSACFEIKTGRAVNPPAEIDLKTYPVKREGDIVYVGIETE